MSLYEDFELGSAQPTPKVPVTKNAEVAVAEAAIDAERSRAAYDKGYTSGWEDATEAASKREGTITAEIERAVEDIAFTYHEATNQVRKEYVEFLRQLLDVFFPSAVSLGLRDNIQAKLEELSEDISDPGVQIYVPPQYLHLFDTLNESNPSLQIEIVEEPSLSHSQVFAKIKDTEWHIDFAPLVEELEDASAEFSEIIAKKVKNGR